MLWKEIKGYKFRYRVGENGEVQRWHEALKQWKTLKPIKRNRYYVKFVCFDGTTKDIAISRLMDAAFFNGRAKKNNLYVYHKNGVKSDFEKENLVLLSRSETGKITGGRHRQKSVVKIKNGEIVECYPSITVAAKKNKLSLSGMQRRIQNKTYDPSGNWFQLEIDFWDGRKGGGRAK